MIQKWIIENQLRHQLRCIKNVQISGQPLPTMGAGTRPVVPSAGSLWILHAKSWKTEMLSVLIQVYSVREEVYGTKTIWEFLTKVFLETFPLNLFRQITLSESLFLLPTQHWIVLNQLRNKEFVSSSSKARSGPFWCRPPVTAGIKLTLVAGKNLSLKTTVGKSSAPFR